jgi:hypothetical protein
VVLLVVSLRGSPSWCVPRKMVVVVVKLVVSVRRWAILDAQLGSSISSMRTVPKPMDWTHVVRPLAKVHADPSGGVIGGSALAEAGSAAATAANATAANRDFLI